MQQIVRILGIGFIVWFVLSGCRKEDDLTTDPSARLAFSTDTVTFDTVFTEIGSATLRFTVRNNNAERVRISSIRLKSGSSSSFRINVDGVPGGEIRDLEIRGRDSAFVFVEVTVDPTNQNSPLVIFDAIEFVTNGNVQEVVLQAWGQDAYYYRPTQFIRGFPPLSALSEYDYYPVTDQTIMPNDKPHVIFGYLFIDSLITLTIPAGTQLHFFDQAGMWCYRGSTLKVNGEPGNEAVFQGFRLESFFDDRPGQWDRIILNEGPNDHEINHALIKNAFIGLSPEFLVLDNVPQIAANKLILRNSVVQNTEGVGILSRNFNIDAENSIVSNSANQLVVIQGGGSYRFNHCTLGNYWRFGARSTGSLFLSNFQEIPLTNGSTITATGDLDVRFENSIIYGPNREELEIDSVGSAAFDIRFDHCAVKTELRPEEPSWFIANPEPVFPNEFDFAFFSNPSDFDFTLLPNAPAIDAGSAALTGSNTMDLDGTTRDALPDLGAYEFK